MERRERRRFLFRLVLAGMAFAAFCGVLLLRLWYVQVHQGAKHLSEIQRQSIRRIRLNPVRGRMLCTDGTVLVDNRPIYDLVFHCSEMRRPGARQNTINHILEQALHISKELRRPLKLSVRRLEQHLSWTPAIPFTVFTDLTPEELARAAELLPPVRGMEIVPRVVRDYPVPGIATHVLGFTGRRRPPDSFEMRRFSYVTRELRGRCGLELQYNRELAGEGGAQLVRVNMLGYVHDGIGNARAPRNGKDLVLTLDSKAQAIADSLLEGVHGAIVLLDVRNGAVLAMASSPTYSLGALTGELYGSLQSDVEDKPLLNRALSAGYTPGSIVKPLVALAGLEAGVVDAGTLVDCSGAYKIGRKPIRCWKRSGHGPVDIVTALKVSCNPYFIHVGQEAGLNHLQPMFEAAGLGHRPGIDLPSARKGLVPSREFALQRWGRRWIAIDTAYVSIGQGALTLSPLQAALYTAAIANGGTVYRPFLVRAIKTEDGNVWRETPPMAASRLPVREANLALVRQGMADAVNADHGTASRAKNDEISLAGKTGTAEVIGPDGRYKNTWFICYGPVDEPCYAFAVVVEHGDSGGKTAAPIGGRFFKEWLGASEPRS